MAIQSFSCAETQALFTTGKSARFANIKKVAERKLAQLDASSIRAVYEGSTRQRSQRVRRCLACPHKWPMEIDVQMGVKRTI
jgi:plasmid maintenance system killer protein